MCRLRLRSSWQAEAEEVEEVVVEAEEEEAAVLKPALHRPHPSR